MTGSTPDVTLVRLVREHPARLGLCTGRVSDTVRGAAYAHLADWLARGYRPASGTVCIERLLTRNRCSFLAQRPDAMPCYPPGDDHPSLWLRDGVPAAYVSQPYQVTDEAAMAAFAARYGLSFSVDAHGSWYVPGGTLLVIWRRATPPR